MKQLVKLNKRPRCGGRKFTYALRYNGKDGKRKCETLGHTNQRKAERQRDQKEKELRMGYVAPDSMRLNPQCKGCNRPGPASEIGTLWYVHFRRLKNG